MVVDFSAAFQIFPAQVSGTKRSIPTSPGTGFCFTREVPLNPTDRIFITDAQFSLLASYDAPVIDDEGLTEVNGFIHLEVLCRGQNCALVRQPIIGFDESFLLSTADHGPP